MNRSILLFLFFIATFTGSLAQSSIEKQIGASSLNMIRKTQGLYTNEPLHTFVKEVGQSLEKQLNLGYPLQYFIIDTDEVNAFASAGGYVFVTRGLLALINNKDELAGILSHELSHVTLHHSTKKIEASILPLVLQLPANIVGLLTYKEVANIINLPISVTSKIGLSFYSRAQETNADKTGVELAIKAGFGPYGLVNALDRLTQLIEFSTGKPMPSNIFIDHPVTKKRLATLTAILEKKGFKKSMYLPGSDIGAQNNLIFGPNPAEGLISKSKFLHLGIWLYCEFPKDWLIQNSPTAITSVSPNKKATIIVSIDSSAYTPESAAQINLGALKEHNILSRGVISLNGLDGYRATVSHKRVKYADQVAEILWIKFPSNIMLRVVGVSRLKSPEPGIKEMLASIRTINASDLASATFSKVTLIEPKQGEVIENYVQKGDDFEKNIKLHEILNGLGRQEIIPNERFLKVIEISPLVKN